MSEPLFLRLRLPEGQTLATCSPEIRGAVTTLVRLRAAALCKPGAFVGNGALGSSDGGGDDDGIGICVGESDGESGDEAGDADSDGENVDSRPTRERARALVRRVRDRAREREDDPVIRKLVDEFAPVVAATLVSEPGAAIRMWRLLYSILSSAPSDALDDELHALMDKFFSKQAARFLLGCVVELGDDAHFLQKFIASASLRSYHAEFAKELLDIEEEFCESLSGMNVNNVVL